MNQTATVHARFDLATKRKSESILKELGMSPHSVRARNSIYDDRHDEKIGKVSKCD